MIVALVTFLILIAILFIKRAEIIAYVGKRKYAKKRDLKVALKWLAVANRTGKLGSESLRYYGWLLLRDGQVDLAKQVLAIGSMSAKKPAAKNRIKAMLAIAEWKSGDLKLAIEMSEEVFEEYKDTVLYENLGLLYNLEGNARKALEFNKKALEYNSDSAGINENLARAYVLYGDIEKAAEIYEKLLEKDPHFPDPYYGYGQLLVEKGEYERGIELIEKALEKNFSFLSVLQKEDVEKILEEARRKKEISVR